MKTTRLLRNKKQKNLEKSRISYKKTQKGNTTRNTLDIKILKKLEWTICEKEDQSEKN